MEPLARHVRLAALILAAAALGACSGSLDINLTDTPVDNASSVVVDFTGVELHNTNGKTVTITFPSAEPIDLLQLQNGTLGALLQGASVPTGNYDWLQLNVLANPDTQGQSYILLTSGTQYPLYVPSGSQSALRILSPFTVTEGRTTQLLVEFDLRQSITSSAADGQNYALVPALRLENQADLGAISADIGLAALAQAQLGAGAQLSQCAAGLFLFAGAAVTPQNGGGASLIDFEPIPTGGLISTQVSISLPNLAPGSYTLAATCDYNLYDPAAVPGQSGYQALHWMVQGNVAVTANATVTSSLPSQTTSNIVK